MSKVNPEFMKYLNFMPKPKPKPKAKPKKQQPTAKEINEQLRAKFLDEEEHA